MDGLKLLQALIQAESPPGAEGPAAQVVLEALKGLGLSPYLDEAGNVEAVFGEGPEVVLTGHLDVVPAGDPSHWTHPPFSGAYREGWVHGRGAVDMKGPLVAMLMAVERLLENPQGRLRFLAVVQEEVGGLGSRYAAERLSPKAFILGEPSRRRLMRGHRGRAEVYLDFEGEEAHAALAGPDNPLYDLGEALEFLKEAAWPAGLKVTPTSVYAFPGAHNQTPGVVRLVLDVRFEPEADLEALLLRLREALPASVYVPEAVRRSGEVERAIPMVWPPYRLPEDHPLLEAALGALGQEEAGLWPFTTDAPYLGAKAPVLGFGPGDPALAHTPKEAILWEEVQKAAEDYVRLVEALWRS
ncbi:M20 family metallopeptidase [Thermus filiformis]|uniref:Acetylornithine deacetylase n=1 Tax=Thermus filiformis TaxID=276 RepID=A0A0A2XAN6_THEFI|nr:M20/M25/M40 family metallo-hydrolase [Thermus filiformis]KGQ22234.2 acetylornithine deacetylase [Thermus filiformis]